MNRAIELYLKQEIVIKWEFNYDFFNEFVIFDRGDGDDDISSFSF